MPIRPMNRKIAHACRLTPFCNHAVNAHILNVPQVTGKGGGCLLKPWIIGEIEDIVRPVSAEYEYEQTCGRGSESL